MVARLVRLRLALLVSVFRGGPRRAIRACVVGIFALAFAGLFAWLPVWMARSTSERVAIDTVFLAMLLVGAAFVSVFARVGQIEPRQFASIAASPAQISTALLLTSVLSWPALWLISWMGLVIWLRPELLQQPGYLALAFFLVIALAVSFARVSSATVRLLVPRNAISVLRWIGLLLLLAALPVVVFVLTEALRAPESRLTFDAARVLGWTPFGAPAAGLGLVEVGDMSGALARFAIAAGTLVILVVAWYFVVARSIASVEAPISSDALNSGLEIFERFPAKPQSVISARVLTYWRRDPRYRVALLAIPIAPIVMIVALMVAGVDYQILALLPLPVILLLLGWSIHNDVALDSTAIWMHVASGTRGAHDRIGRFVPVLLVGVPLAIVGSSISVTIVGDWRILPAVIGMNLGVLLVSLASSNVFSALMPYPATRPGDSPFAQPAVQGAGAGLAQTLSMLAAILLSIPVVVFSVQATTDPTFLQNVWGLVFGLGWGAVVLLFSVWLGGKLFDRSASELLGLTQTFD